MYQLNFCWQKTRFVGSCSTHIQYSLLRVNPSLRLTETVTSDSRLAGGAYFCPPPHLHLSFSPSPEKEKGTKKRRCEEEEEEDELEEHILCSLALYSPLMHASSSIQCTSSFCNSWCGRNRGGHIICDNSFIALLASGLGQPCLYTRKIAHPIACLLDWI